MNTDMPEKDLEDALRGGNILQTNFALGHLKKLGRRGWKVLYRVAVDESEKPGTRGNAALMMPQCKHLTQEDIDDTLECLTKMLYSGPEPMSLMAMRGLAEFGDLRALDDVVSQRERGGSVGNEAVSAGVRLIKVHLSKKLRRKRKSAKISQVQLAKLMGSSQANVSKMERAAQGITIDLIFKALLVMGVHSLIEYPPPSE